MAMIEVSDRTHDPVPDVRLGEQLGGPFGALAQLCERGRTRESVDIFAALSESANPHLIARNEGRVGKEHERASQQRGVEDIHTASAEHLLTEDHGKGDRKGHHPQGHVDRHNERDQHPCNKIAFRNFVAAYLRKYDLDTETHAVRDEDQRQHPHKTVPPAPPYRGLGSNIAYGAEVLQPRVVHPEQQRRHEGHNDHYKRAFQIDRIANVRPLFRNGIRQEQERIHGVEQRMKETEFPSLFERRLHPVDNIPY